MFFGTYLCVSATIDDTCGVNDAVVSLNAGLNELASVQRKQRMGCIVAR